MSHFTVLVIGENPEDQLQPYHEFECTGIDDKYIQDVDVTEEVRVEGLDYHGLEDRVVENESEIDKSGDHKHGYAIVKDGVLVKAVNRTNPNKKWDWYVLGGRWTGYFKVKENHPSMVGEKSFLGSPARDGYADQLMKGAVDFDYMRTEKGQEAGDDYDKFHAIVAGREIPSWEKIRESHGDDIDAARKEYHNNPVVKDLSKSEDFRFAEHIERYAVSRDEFVKAAQDRAYAPYAIIKNGEWYAKGRMGWFGFSDDKMTQDDWNRKVVELIENLPDDTLLSLYDCHI